MFCKKSLDKLNAIYGRVTAMEQSINSQIELNSIQLYNLTDKTEELRYTVTKTMRSYEFDYSWLDDVPPLIAHALGGIDGYTYTNSREAFLNSYEQGFRVFEVDFQLSDPENILLAYHEIEDWQTQTGIYNDADTMDYDTFMSTPLYGQYTTMDYRDIIDLMVEYPDIYLITDTKFTDRSSVFLEFSQLVRYAEEIDSSVLDRIIPQIYHEDMLEWVMDVYQFKSVIFTLYKTTWTKESVEEFCQLTGVNMIAIDTDCEAAIEWNELGINVGVFTVNDLEQAQQLQQEYGADLIYTDFLQPKDFE